MEMLKENYWSISSFFKSSKVKPKAIQFSLKTKQKSTEDLLLEAYETIISSEDRVCASNLEKTWCKTKPLLGKRILVNCHITLSTLITYRLLMIGGAEVEVTASQKKGEELAVQKNVLKKINVAGLIYYPDGKIPYEKAENYYDIVIDCGAGMLDTIIPRQGGGMIELTHTNPALYKNITFPVINVDESRTKEIETTYGTGDSIIRLLNHMAQQNFSSVCELIKKTKELSYRIRKTFEMHFLLVGVKQMFVGRKWVVFGYGKVGKGIVNALKSVGVYGEDIIVVDINPDVVLSVSRNGCKFLQLSDSEQDITAIKRVLKETQYAITATGVKDTISRYFELDDFKDVPILINMGTPDEFGPKFPADRLLNGVKGPGNFILEYPTSVMYLDPPFTLLAMAASSLMTKKYKFTAGLQKTPKEMDLAVLKTWMQRHKDKVWKHTSCATLFCEKNSRVYATEEISKSDLSANSKELSQSLVYEV
jgi:S-adenosylhomocysteine hydrolase